jgi:hypothetical protein
MGELFGKPLVLRAGGVQAAFDSARIRSSSQVSPRRVTRALVAAVWLVWSESPIPPVSRKQATRYEIL